MLPDLKRRQFLQLTSSAALASALFPSRMFASDEMATLYQQAIPAKKALDPAWLTSLFQRGNSLDAGIRAHTEAELDHIGMTVGGIACGTVYLSGDGRLYVWDVFHKPHEGVVPHKAEIPSDMLNIKGGGKKARERDGANYIDPPTALLNPNPFRQGFSIELNGKSQPLDRSGWKDVTFTGRWPMGIVDFADPASPVSVKLEAWTPFIPLETDNSSLPVTVMEYTLTNKSSSAIKGKLIGQWENPVLIHSKKGNPVGLKSELIQQSTHSILHHHSVTEDANLKQASDWGSATLTLLNQSATASNDDSLTVEWEISAGSSQQFSFLLTWHFPNMPAIKNIPDHTPHYTTRFADAVAVANHVAQNFESLRSGTQTWVDTWNNSTLPQWVLDRSILTTNTLQTTTCHLLSDRRFWAWEGIGCCPGTCAHVWHYAQGVARLFPDLERNLREVTDYGIAINDDGAIRFRAESAKTIAIDAQTGIILRTWREHLISADNQFLKRVWPNAKRAIEWLIRFDENGRGGLDGLLDGEQHNTLDAEWYGKVHCLCSLYLASLLAARAMAKEVGDTEFAKRCETIHAQGAEKIASLFNGEFYIQEIDPAHANAVGVGDGCYIDQVIGQWWAHEVALGRVYNRDHILSALDSLWRYNFAPNINRFRKAFPQGRFYAMGDEAGLVMCTWPKGGIEPDFSKHWQAGYFNECMSGFEWQVAAHMIQEGDALDASGTPAEFIENSKDPRSHTLRGLAIARAIHDRYSAAKRNPYNEIECSDHYARANASYSVFLSLCGFSYDGPKGIIGFNPKINPKSFKSAFTAAEGWGTFEQQRQDDGSWKATITLKHGKLSLNQIHLPWLKTKTTASLGDQSLKTSITEQSIHFDSAITLNADGTSLVIATPA